MPPPTITVLACRVIASPATWFARDRLQAVQGFFQSTGDEPQGIIAHNQGRSEGDAVVEACHRVAVLADNETPLLAPGDALRDLVGRCRDPALLVFDEFYAEEEALVPDLPDVRVAFELGQFDAQPLAHPCRAPGQVLVVHDLEVLYRQRARRRVAAEGVEDRKSVV